MSLHENLQGNITKIAYDQTERKYRLSHRSHLDAITLCVLLRFRQRPLQIRPVGQAPQGAHGVHQAPDPRTGEGVLRPQLPDATAALRDRCSSGPDRETGKTIRVSLQSIVTMETPKKRVRRIEL